MEEEEDEEEEEEDRRKGEERRGEEERGGPSFQNEDPTPRDGWEKIGACGGLLIFFYFLLHGLRGEARGLAWPQGGGPGGPTRGEPAASWGHRGGPGPVATGPTGGAGLSFAEM